MSFQKSIIETIRRRKSIRTYETRNISEEDHKKIHDYLGKEENRIGPLGRTAKLHMVPVSHNVTDKGMKVGTYGFIKNPQGYIVGIIENDKEALVAFGYIFEKFILYMTEISVGTCWLGGTFNRNSFEKEINIDKNEIIPCVTPIGYGKEKLRLMDKTLRYVVKADHKKGWDQLFYYGNFQTKLTQEEAEPFSIPMEMIRLGPSASNKQPWRLILSEDKKTCHFYLEHTPNYSGNKMGFDMQRIDIGIAMCHFELSCEALNLKGNWIIDNPEIDTDSRYMEYIISWRPVKSI